ncbi:MAG: hypothetical protein AAFY99_05635 [Pseudomonadota bacterium]
MHIGPVIAGILVSASIAQADPLPSAVEQCLSCHVQADGLIDIIGLQALSALPAEWQYLFEDAYDLDGNGIAGAMRYVSGSNGPLPARFGTKLAAASFDDFAKIAGAAHNIVLSEEVIEQVRQVFEERSPRPVSPFPDAASQREFVTRGCADCHVTRTYEFRGETVMPLSDFLLHDLGDGLQRTTPLWGCEGCTDGNPHTTLENLQAQ